MSELLMQLFPQLGQLLPEPLHAMCEPISFAKGNRVFEMGCKPEYMYFVQRGEVILERLAENGDTVVLQRTRHGFIGEASMHAQAYHCDAKALAVTEAVRIPIRELQQTLMCDSAFSTRWMAMLSQELRRIRLQCERMSLKTVQERLTHFLKTEGNAGTYMLNSGIKSLSAELGVSHEALYRCLSSLKRQGRIKHDSAGLHLLAD